MIGLIRMISKQNNRKRALTLWDNMDARQLEDLGVTRAELSRHTGNRF